jgi:hypothetical protein
MHRKVSIARRAITNHLGVLDRYALWWISEQAQESAHKTADDRDNCEGTDAHQDASSHDLVEFPVRHPGTGRYDVAHQE